MPDPAFGESWSPDRWRSYRNGLFDAIESLVESNQRLRRKIVEAGANADG